MAKPCKRKAAKHKIYKALRRKGHSEESAARISYSVIKKKKRSR